jgi:hypothetical protein
MSKSIAKPGFSPVSSRDDIETFLKGVRTSPKPGTSTGRLVFGMDATLSRQPTWDRALSIQSEMFVEAAASGSLAIQLVYFRGFLEGKASKWITDGATMARLMSKVECRGGNTQIGRLLKHIKSETSKQRVSAAVFVGDALEENIDALCATAGEIGLLGTPVFMFQEGGDSHVESGFRSIAQLTGGAFFKLDGNSAAQLAEVLRAVAAYAAGGQAALENRAGTSNASRVLISQMRKQ